MPPPLAGVAFSMPENAEATRDVATVERLIAAPAETIFDLLADPARHAEIDGSGTVRGVSESEGQRLALGDKFGMSMHMGIGYTRRTASSPGSLGPPWACCARSSVAASGATS